MTSVILAGTEDSDNELAAETPGQYQHITTLSEMSQPDLALLKKLVNVTPTDSKKSAADMLDALILGVHIIVQHCRHLKYVKQIVVFTDFDHPIDWQDFDEVSKMLKTNDIALVVIRADAGSPVKSENKSVKEENEQQWKQLVETTEQGAIYSLEEAYETASAFRTKEVRPTPAFRGFLQLGDPKQYPDTSLAISVFMYARTYEYRLPSAKKWSALSDTAEDLPASELTHQVTMERRYKLKPSNYTGRKGTDADGDDNEADQGEPAASGAGQQESTDNDTSKQDEPGAEVAETDLERAYMYGKTVLKLSEEEERYLQLETEPGMTILGFFKADQLPRDYLMANVYVITAGAHNKESASTAIAALSHALYEKQAVALARYVSRANSAPKLGVLMPYHAPDIHVLHFAQVPFAEDIRQFTYSSLDRIVMASGKVITEDHPLLPTPDMLDSMETFVQNMSLMDLPQKNGEHGEYLVPEDTYNPAPWRLNEAIKMRALNEAAPVPDTHPTLAQELRMVPELEEKNKDHIEKMKELFKIKKVDVKAAKKRGYGAGRERDGAQPQEGAGMPSVEDIISSQVDGQTKKVKVEDQASYDAAMQSMLKKDVRDISSVNPVADFKAMIANTNEDLVTEAVDKMGKMVITLVTTSFGDQYYSKAMDCLKTMRSTAAEALQEDEAGAFNQHLYQLRSECDINNPNSRRLDFWKQMKDQHMTLITKDESKDADVANVTKEDADNFLSGTGTTTAPAISSEKEDTDYMDTDNLLDMLE
ncbi:SPOC like C-terminal domain-containing protein [Radiomyces spectabilis]|uniref:SPOC like C-terminal domain-containing protein n=1 Tax=Radiomyces spectabilis TaxID=64574 RepID=UPI0022208CF0|nr:SPOC like C-terminal domain-containing protein [Radiomyces spectabilis]KAI8379437.1 SPOC like C-terminal domain-containing protein [Radiomyces spectabilis]